MLTDDALISRRDHTLGANSPLFYNDPLHFVSGSGVWLTAASGERYLDAYNNVPHVGHSNERVVQALHRQAAKLNIHTRYLNERIVDYAEQLLASFASPLDRVLFGNSGSEANELAIRISRQATQSIGIVVSDYSYHGNTITLAELTTGLKTREALAPHVRTLRIPDFDLDDRSVSEIADATLADLDHAIASLKNAGYGLAACLFDPIFSTEGMPKVPPSLTAAIARRIHDAGGLVIADEVQSGFGRTGHQMWGHTAAQMSPDLVTIGKPMGNGHPMSAVITSSQLLSEFGENNEYFNTFAGNPVSAAVGEAVLQEMTDRNLMEQAATLGDKALTHLRGLASRYDFIRAAKGKGMFLGIDFSVDGTPSPYIAQYVVEAMKARHVLVSRSGRDSNVLKIRPPLSFGPQELPLLLSALDDAIATV